VIVKALCKPLSPRDPSDFDAALDEMAAAGLVERYRVDHRRYVQVLKWDEHQEGLHKRTKSDFPEIPEVDDEAAGTFREVPGTSGQLPELPAETKRREEKRSEEKGRERARGRATASSPPASSEPPTEAEQAVIANLREVEGYRPDDGKDLALVRALAKDYPGVDLARESAAWRIYKLDHPLEAKSSPRSQFRSWVRFEVEHPRPGQARASPMRIETATAEDIAWAERERAAGRAAW